MNENGLKIGNDFKAIYSKLDNPLDRKRFILISTDRFLLLHVLRNTTLEPHRTVCRICKKLNSQEDIQHVFTEHIEFDNSTDARTKLWLLGGSVSN